MRSYPRGGWSVNALHVLFVDEIFLAHVQEKDTEASGKAQGQVATHPTPLLSGGTETLRNKPERKRRKSPRRAIPFASPAFLVEGELCWGRRFFAGFVAPLRRSRQS